MCLLSGGRPEAGELTGLSAPLALLLLLCWLEKGGLAGPECQPPRCQTEWSAGRLAGAESRACTCWHPCTSSPSPAGCQCSPGARLAMTVRVCSCLPASKQQVPVVSPSLWWAAAGGQLHRNNPRSLWLGWIGWGEKDESLWSKYGNRKYYSTDFFSTCTTLPLIFTAKILCSPTYSQSAALVRATLKRLAGPWRTPLPLVPVMAWGCDYLLITWSAVRLKEQLDFYIFKLTLG